MAFLLVKLSTIRFSSLSGLSGNSTNLFVVKLLMILFLLLTNLVVNVVSLYDELLLSHNPMMVCCGVMLSDKDLLMVLVI